MRSRVHSPPEPRLMMQRADPTTRRRQRRRPPSPRDGSTSCRSCSRDHERPGPCARARGLACGPRRWAIRWATPGPTRPYQAEREAPISTPICACLQGVVGLNGQRTPCFTRERSQVRNPPRPSPGSRSTARIFTPLRPRRRRPRPQPCPRGAHRRRQRGGRGGSFGTGCDP
jgi:hypothetical protein